MKKTLREKIVRFKKIYKFPVVYFFIGVISFLLFIKKRSSKNQKFNFPAKKYEIRKNIKEQNCLFQKDLQLDIKQKSSAKREYYDENMFFKAHRAISKWNFLFHLESKTNLVICI